MTRKQKRASIEDTEPFLVGEEALSGSNPPSLAHKYWCGCCNFSAKTPSGFRNHLYSNRHYRNWSKNISVKGDDHVSSSIDAGIASNDIIYLLDEIDSSVGVRSDTGPKLIMTELDDIESNVDTSSHYSESDSASDDSEYASDSEYDNNMESDEDIDLPLYGTGSFYPDASHGCSASSRTLKDEKCDDMPDPLFMATAFVLGMVAERCYSQFVRNLCAC